LPHMKYEGSIGLLSRKMKKNYAYFHVFGLFIAKNMIWAKKNFRLSRAGDVAVVRRNLCHAYSLPLKS
jgi:hypothetical protein